MLNLGYEIHIKDAYYVDLYRDDKSVTLQNYKDDDNISYVLLQIYNRKGAAHFFSKEYLVTNLEEAVKLDLLGGNE